MPRDLAVRPMPAAAPHTSFDAPAQRIFIEALAETGSVTAAAERAGVSRMTAYRHRHAPEAHAFRKGWDEALARAIGMLADVALARAIHGVEEPVYWKGEEVGTRTRYSDRLLMFMLRHRSLYNPTETPDPRAWHITEPRHSLANYVGTLEAIAPAPAGARVVGQRGAVRTVPRADRGRPGKPAPKARPEV